MRNDMCAVNVFEKKSNMLKVLVIDDNENTTDMMKEFLTLEGFDATISNDGKSGLKLIQNGNFDKILLDLSMPDFTGFDVLNSLKGNFDMKKILLFTACAFSSGQEDDLLKLGIHSIVPKPADLSELLISLKSSTSR